MSDPHEWHKRAQWAEASYPCLRCMSEALIDARQALAAAQQAQRDAEAERDNWRNLRTGHAYSARDYKQRAEAAETDLQRVREALGKAEHDRDVYKRQAMAFRAKLNRDNPRLVREAEASLSPACEHKNVLHTGHKAGICGDCGQEVVLTWRAALEATQPRE